MQHFRIRNLLGATALAVIAATALPSVATAAPVSAGGPTLGQEFGPTLRTYFTANIPASAVIVPAAGEGATGWGGVQSVSGGPTEPASFAVVIDGRSYNVYDPQDGTLAASASRTLPATKSRAFLSYVAGLQANDPGWQAGQALVVANGPSTIPA